MNEAKQQLDAGNLSGAIEAALAHVKSKPTDIPARIFLFELSCFSGDWDRAEKQLDVIGAQDPKAMIGSLIYRQNFKAERDRMADRRIEAMARIVDLRLGVPGRGNQPSA